MNIRKHYIHTRPLILLSLLLSGNAHTAALLDDYSNSGNYDMPTFACTQTMPDGSTYNTPSGSCCTPEEFETNPSACAAEYSCTETKSGTGTRTKKYGWHIEGVPTFWQHTVTPHGDREYAVGCGSIAVTTLLLWYHALGYTDIGNDYYTNRGKINWQKMAEVLAGDDYLNTKYPSVANPDSLGATTTNRVQRAIEDFLDSKELENSVSHLEVSESGDPHTWAPVALDRIKHSIQNGRPVIIGFDSNAADGIGNRGDDWNFIDHYGVITGVDDSRFPEVLHINMGWGDTACNDGTESDEESRACQYDWYIGSGTVHLWFVDIPAGEKNIGYEVCPASYTGELNTLYAYAKDAGVTIAPELSKDDSYPTLKRLIRKTNCQVRGGERDVEYSYEHDVTRTTLCTNYTGGGELSLDTEDTSIVLDRLSPRH